MHLADPEGDREWGTDDFRMGWASAQGYSELGAVLKGKRKRQQSVVHPSPRPRTKTL